MTKTLIKLIKDINEVMTDNKKYLTELDSAIGDGDHGINMTRGFSKVVEKLENNQYEQVSKILKDVGMTLVSNVGGASGPLYGTAFINASKVINDDNIDFDNIVEIGETVINGIQKRGNAKKGDKTMLDTIIPAVEELKKGKNENKDLEKTLKKCVKKAKKGMKDTIPLIARKGRAQYLSERSKGHQDPGATSSYLIIKTIIEGVLDDNRI